MDIEPIKPNLFIVGATKSGTSSLHQYLDQHPDIFMSKKKEPHFFSYDGEIPNYNGPGDNIACKKMMVLNKNDYMNLFDNSEKYKYRGESSAMYLHLKGTAKKIHDFNANAMIIIILRNPVQRLISAYNHLKRDGRETETMECALTCESERVRNNWMPFWFYKTQSMYYSQLKEYFECFPPKNIKVFIYEEFFEDIDKSMNDICAFLKLDNFAFDTNYKENMSGNPKSKLLHNTVRNPPQFIKTFYQIIPQNYRKKIKYWLNVRNLDKPELIDEKLLFDLRKEFSDEIIKIENLLDRSVDVWR